MSSHLSKTKDNRIPACVEDFLPNKSANIGGNTLTGSVQQKSVIALRRRVQML